MPVSVSVDLAQQRVHITIEGDLTVEDAIRAAETVVSAPGLRPGFEILSDHRRIGTTLSPDQVHRFASVLEGNQQLFRGARWAAVVARPTSYGLMRMLAARVELVADMRARVFTDLDEAKAWLLHARD